VRKAFYLKQKVLVICFFVSKNPHKAFDKPPEGFNGKGQKGAHDGPAKNQ
jgi:hypothetical protein